MNYERSLLEDQVKHFLSLLRVERNLSSKTVKAYHSDLNGLIHWLNSQQLSIIDLYTLRQYFEFLQDYGLKPRTIQRKYIALNQFFRYLNQEGITQECFFSFRAKNFKFLKVSHVHCILRKSAVLFPQLKINLNHLHRLTEKRSVPETVF